MDTELLVPDPLKLARTRAAVAEFDRVYAVFQALLLRETRNRYVTNAESDAAYERVEAADRAVREAFADDTADRNPRQNALLVGPGSPWLRRLLERHPDA
jgi:hypothetical protein